MDPTDPAALGILPGTTYAVDPSSAYPIAGYTGITSGTGTGQHGTAPVIGGNSTMGGAITSVWDWLNKPFTTPMSPVEVGLLVGTVIVAILVWNLILYHIRIAAETI